MDNNYKYKNIPLSPNIIEELTIELFSGRLITRQEIVDEVSKHHNKNGGINSNAIDLSRTFKTALSKLKEKKIVTNPSHGYWKIGEVSLPLPYIEDIVDFDTKQIDLIADKIIGEGRGSIYMYYLPMYRLKAESENESIWHCKIGKTDRDPLSRVLSQAATALPEKPHIALIFKTNYPSEFEGAIHRILTIRGRRLDTSPGSEWFLTSPDEIEKIIGSIQDY
jgi:hypothetical protein